MLCLCLCECPYVSHYIYTYTGRVEFKGWYFIEAYMDGAPYGRAGVGGGVLSDEAAALGAIGSPYMEDDWFELLDKRGRTILNKEYKKVARMSLSFRVDRNYDPGMRVRIGLF